MINKFRYKKPANKDNASASDTDKDKGYEGSVIKCGDNKDDTLRRKKKDISVKSDTKTDTLKRDKSAGVLSEETKKQLHELFSQLQFSTETALPPDALRRALAESFFDQNRFQLGFMDDAAECFENMLLRIHTHIAQGEAEDMCNAKHCIPHQKFAMTLVEQSVCGSCGATSEPLSYTQMVHYVSTSTLVYQVRTNAGRPNPPDPFGQLLRKAGNMGDIRTCPSACGAVIQIGRTLMNHPEIVSIGLVWNSERPTLEHIMEVFSTIGTNLRLGDVFSTLVDSRWAENSMHNLVGVVTYYGKHYSTFFFHTKLRVWIYFDDATVREVGPRWEQVVEKCRKGRYQPLLLLYALPDGTPVNTENAPKQVTPLFSEKVTKKPPPQSVLRRSITPSPEKPVIGNTRRAITPNPDGSAMNQKPPLPRPYNEYQNLSIIQKNIYGTQANPDVDVVDGCIGRKDPEYVTRKSLDFNKAQVSVHRTLSNGSSSGMEGMSIPDHMNVPRRRDSGNWSGDRNSASSASSTTMENPYLYLVVKVPHGTGSVPGSPTRTKSESSSGSSGVYDAGYDSYSLSSNDSSSMTTLQHLMKMGHLAKIPEDYNNPSTTPTLQSCDVLCDEADELLVKSRQLEDEHDLVLALALCNAAATKARAAMNAPYNNPQTLTLARMKHNTCIMRARSLHRRMTQTQNLNKETPPEIRHTREGSSSSTGRHSRQNSRDKSSHSRQNSRELLVPEKEKAQPSKNIEIYATLPKKKDALKSKMTLNLGEDEEYMLYDKPPGRESRSIFSRSKNKDNKLREKRSRSEDRNKISRDFSLAPEIITGKDTLKKAKEEKEEKKDKDGKPKKQHKIRRKLLMGGLIKRKNRSMPDLTDANVVNETPSNPPRTTVDDSNVRMKGATDNQAGMCGYLSEGHLEFTGSNTNPNLERSKLMRKSFHGSAGKILTAAKVPPPPPLRTTSQLSKAKLNSDEVCDESNERPKYPLPNDISDYQNTQDYNYNNDTCDYVNQEPVSLPYYHESFYNNESYYRTSPNTVITRADVHHEQSPIKPTSYNTDSGVDDVDCLPSHSSLQNLDLPPYPSPIGSVVHSRQASEDFPPPPPPLDLSALDEYLPKLPSSPLQQSPSTLLSQLQNKRQEILNGDSEKIMINTNPATINSSGDTWLKELQAKQAALRSKRNQSTDNIDEGVDVVNTQRYLPGESKVKSVKDLASKFEFTDHKPPVHACKYPVSENKDPVKSDSNGVLSMKKREERLDASEHIAAEQIAEEIREVEMLNAAVQKSLNASQEMGDECKKRLPKKKSVSFCDQVILVATADEQEDDSYIPNPILERVLRTAMNKPETAAIRQEILTLRENEMKKQEMPEYPLNNTNDIIEPTYNQPLYVRRNSVDNLLSRPNTEFDTSKQPLLRQSPTCSIPPQTINASVNQSPVYNGPNTHYNNQSPHHFNGQNCLYDTNCQYNANPPYNGPYTGQSQAVPIPQYNNQHRPALLRQNSHNEVLNQQCTRQNYPHEIPNPQYNYNNAYNCQTTNGYETQCTGNCSPVNYNAQNTPYRQSPYQLIPQNSSAYATYYSNNRVSSATVQSNLHQNHSPQYSASPRNGFIPQIRQSTPSPMNGHPNYQHPPSPAPSNVSSTYNYQQNMYRGPSACENTVPNSPYQRVPPPVDQGYIRSPTNEYEMQQNNSPYQRVPYQPDRPEIYQRVPPPHCEQDAQSYQQTPPGKYSPYQHALPPKQILKKTVSFEPGTKGCGEAPAPNAIVTPIIVNNTNNSVPTDKTKCNLCRKKNVVSANLYCQDCKFYMSRFKPRS